MKTVLLRRKLLWKRGSDFKSFDYVNHINAHPDFVARLNPVSIDSGAKTPWRTIPGLIVDDWRAVDPDVMFIHSLDWLAWMPVIDALPDRPRINLIQAMPASRLERLGPNALRHRAIRICISPEVAEEFISLGPVEGPVITIPNGIDLTGIPAPPPNPSIDVLIVSLKQPTLGNVLHQKLQRPGREVMNLSVVLPHADFLHTIASARITLFLPLREEGFYLPALEGMAASTLVICPDSTGNRVYCDPEVNCLQPTYTAEALAAAAERALSMSTEDANALHRNGLVTAANFSLTRERQAFHAILENLDQIW